MTYSSPGVYQSGAGRHRRADRHPDATCNIRLAFVLADTRCGSRRGHITLGHVRRRLPRRHRRRQPKAHATGSLTSAEIGRLLAHLTTAGSSSSTTPSPAHAGDAPIKPVSAAAITGDGALK